MIVLNLETKDSQQKIIKTYLQENVSEDLAKKINKGVEITKDGKTLISRKDLDGFMEYACKTAQEQAEKGKRSAFVEDDVVFGWAMHYFEEDSIEGTLYNPDGTKYEPPKPKYTPKPVTVITPPPKKDIQPNMFDLLNKSEDTNNKFDDDTDIETEENEDEEDFTEEEKQEVLDESDKEEPKKISPIYLKYLDTQKQYPENVIVIRLGDFYEVFGDNAVKIADELGLTLTGRDVGLSERIPVIGFPYHAAEIYIRKIIDKGHKVALVESSDSRIIEQDGMKIDTETGEILKPTDNDLISVLTEMFGNTMEIRL